MSTILLDGEQYDTSEFARDPVAYAETLHAALSPHIDHVLVSVKQGQTHYNVVHSIGLGLASVTALFPGGALSDYFLYASLGSEGTFLPDRELVPYFGYRQVDCATCGVQIQKG